GVATGRLIPDERARTDDPRRLSVVPGVRSGAGRGELPVRRPVRRRWALRAGSTHGRATPALQGRPRAQPDRADGPPAAGHPGLREGRWDARLPGAGEAGPLSRW